jgi:hypothetical protein
MTTTRVSLHGAAALLLILMIAPVQAADVLLGWEPSTTVSGHLALSNLTRSQMYDGQSEVDVSVVRDFGNQLSYTVTDLEGGQIDYIAVTAEDDLGYENEFPNLMVRARLETGVHPTDDDGIPTADDGTTSDHQAIEDAGEEMAEPVAGQELASRSWMNYRVTLTLRSARAEDIGVMFRYQDRDNYYRVSWSHQHAEPRVVKCEHGVFTLLATDATLDISGPPYELTIVADGMSLEMWINGRQLFSIADAQFPQGTIALYGSGRGANVFDNILVEDLATADVLLWDDFTDGVIRGWTFVNDAPGKAASVWTVEAGMLVQRSAPDAGQDDPADLAQRGTFALYLN